MEKQTWKETYEHGERGGEGEMYGESIMETYITICKIANGNLLYDSGNSKWGSVTTDRGRTGGRWGEGRMVLVTLNRETEGEPRGP